MAISWQMPAKQGCVNQSLRWRGRPKDIFLDVQWLALDNRYLGVNQVSQSPINDEFMALILPCQSRLFGYLYMLLHNLSDTEDVLQQAMMAMWAHFGEYDRERNFLNWAMEFAKLTALNHLRSRRRSRVVFSDELVLLVAESCAAGEEDADSLASYHDALLRCMDRLTPGDRRLIRLCYFEKCSIEAAAEQLGRAPQSVCNSLRRIRGILFDCVQESTEPEDRP
jgi:RNA polymerase sigma-70 factor, ECF subfamily